MENNINVNKDILFYAFRYSLPRGTFAPTQVIDAIKNNIVVISDRDLEQYIEEINDHKQRYGFGMECDERDWVSFAEYLKKELELREYNKLRLD